MQHTPPAVGLQVEAGDEPLPREHGQAVVAVGALRRWLEDLKNLVETEEPSDAGLVPIPGARPSLFCSLPHSVPSVVCTGMLKQLSAPLHFAQTSFIYTSVHASLAQPTAITRSPLQSSPRSHPPPCPGRHACRTANHPRPMCPWPYSRCPKPHYRSQKGSWWL